MFTIGKDPVVANKHEWLTQRYLLCAIVSWSAGYVQTVPVVARNSSGLLPVDGVFDWRTLSNAMLSLGIYEDVQGALKRWG